VTASPDPKTASFGVTILYFLGFGLFLGALSVVQLGMDTGKWAESLVMLPVGLGIGLVVGSVTFAVRRFGRSRSPR
jgi:hypothetical protein